jgi:hypothetical protein
MLRCGRRTLLIILGFLEVFEPIFEFSCFHVQSHFVVALVGPTESI